MRYAEVTMKYVLPVPDDEADDPGINTVISFGQSMIENVLRDKAKNIMELRSDWQIMPREWRPSVSVEGTDATLTQGRVPKMWEDRDEAKFMIENDFDRGVSFAGNIMGQGRVGDPMIHPWDQGLWIFPEDHPMHILEVHARKIDDRDMAEILQAAAPKMKELPRGETDSG